MWPEGIIVITARLIDEDRERRCARALLLAQIARTAAPAPPTRVRLGRWIVGMGERLAGSCAYPPPAWRAARAAR